MATQTKKQENEWADDDFDAEFEDDNDDEFNQNGGGWENSDPEDDPFEDNPGDWDDIETGQDDASEIENKYYEAYYEKDDMDLKLASFLKVIELIEAGGDDTDDFGFKSLTEIVVLYLGQQNQTENVIKYFKEFLTGSKNMKPNDLSSNLRKILNTAKSNMHIYNELHDLTMQTFNPLSCDDNNSGSIKHLWFDLGIERCHDFMTYKIYKKCENLVAELHESLKKNGNDDKSQTAKLLQVYAVKIQLTMKLIDDLAMNDNNGYDEDEYNKLQFSLRELIDITRGIMTNVDIIDNKAMSIIYECWAKVYATSNDWSNCYKYFKESFLLYQQIAHKNTTKCLKSLLISYMILSSLPQSNEDGKDKIPNPFAMDEISVYQNHHEIIIINNLVNAFENDDINSFNKLLKQQHETDAFINKYLAFVQLRLQGKALCNLVKSYDRVKLGWLCDKLGMKLDGVEKLIVKLIIDGELNGRLDQVNMFLILKERDNKANAILNSLSLWLKSVNTLRNTINSRAANKSSSFGGMRGMGGMSGYGGFGMMDYFDDDINDDLYVMDQSFLSWN